MKTLKTALAVGMTTTTLAFTIIGRASDHVPNSPSG